jgi:hypothetical protein
MNELAQIQGSFTARIHDPLAKHGEPNRFKREGLRCWPMFQAPQGKQTTSLDKTSRTACPGKRDVSRLWRHQDRRGRLISMQFTPGGNNGEHQSLRGIGGTQLGLVIVRQAPQKTYRQSTK